MPVYVVPFLQYFLIIIKSSSSTHLLSHWKRRLATTLQRENVLFILNTSANILYASNRYTPNQDTYIDEVLNDDDFCLIILVCKCHFILH